MKIFQKNIQLSPKKRGFHIITDVIIAKLEDHLTSIQFGTLHVFIKHTSASLTINENADFTVRQDFESHFNEMIPEDMSYYRHNYEGSDDMPAHIKSSVLGSSILIPVSNGHLNLGLWQGIYLCEHRDHASSRHLVLTLTGE